MAGAVSVALTIAAAVLPPGAPGARGGPVRRIARRWKLSSPAAD
ncbi:hypothetical protein BZL29_4002 [Mycobacterium kansasii]|uniref:Uncharacterized protein n=1 Tax=Mycobacterium kansasii TaxID=1768 RepID=A0A1V3XCX0_MYCKA|nr:hypothetical protein BZL29_4002 [Mycobacterium kansasii]